MCLQRLPSGVGGRGEGDTMIKRLSAVLAFISLVFMSGCASIPQDIHMSRQVDVEAGNYSMRVDQYAAGEIPTVVVTGCGGHNVTVRIIDLSTENIVKTYKDYVPENWTRWWWFNNLPKGSYIAVLIIEGETKASVKFKIDNS
jgi:starvation-inducible outer membrane lipoprotein